MKIFGYGSLMNEKSLQKSFNEFEVIGLDSLDNYYRIFNFKSPSRCNKETGEYSSVLNLTKHEGVLIFGVVIEIPEHEINTLKHRERGYDFLDVQLSSGEIAYTFISKENHNHHYVFEDSVQREYLDLCLSASRHYGDAVYKNFITTTFLREGLSVEEYLTK